MKNRDTPRILIVDDQIHALQGMSRIMRGAGYEVLEASNGEDCLQMAAAHKPDLILLDVVLPDIDGREVCRRIKSNPEIADIYVVIFSSVKIESDSQAEGLEQGADGYISRPMPNRELRARVASILRLKYAENRWRDSEEQFRALFESNSAVMLLIEPETGRIIDSNRAAGQFYGYTMPLLRSMFIQEIIVASPEEVKTKMLFASKEGPNCVSFPNRLAGGEVRTVEVYYSPVEQNGKLLLFSIIYDITDRKRAEDNLARALEIIRVQKSDLEKALDLTGSELLDSERRFKILFEAAQDFIFVKDKELHYIDVNPAVLELLQMERQDIIGKTDRELFGDTVGVSRENIETRVLQGQTIESREHFIWKSQPITLDVIRFPVKAVSGEAGGVCGIAREIVNPSLTSPVQVPPVREYLSDAIRMTFARAELAAETNSTILLTGDTGSGKDFLARYIHDGGSRSTGPYYAINCAAIPHELAESELFGHETGAFTGAVRKKRGLLELAEGGTLMLNEIGELPLHMQSKLLTFLDTRSFTRVGGEKNLSVNVRLIAATSKDLCTEVSEGRFRKDLFYRLDVFPIHVPPLRERLEDIPMMVDTILERLATELQLTRVPRINRSAVEGLSRYEWPGNVRELRNVLEGALISCRGGEIGIRHLRLGQVEGTTDSQREKLASGKSLGDIVEDTQRSVIEEALRSADGKKQKAARLLGISRSSLGRLMFKLGISARN